MGNPAGSFIWYELMTDDPDGAAAFYGPVVGWTLADAPGDLSGGVDYRMIVRSDGGNAGGVLKLSDEMQQGGARPCWDQARTPLSPRLSPAVEAYARPTSRDRHPGTLWKL